MPKFLLLTLLACVTCWAQQKQRFPLESVTITGSRYPEKELLEIAGLALGAPVDESDFLDACKKLQATGLFEAAKYQFTPGPKKIGYALTLSLREDPETMAASIDVPGLDEKEIWTWVRAANPFIRDRAPANDAAQDFYARAIELALAEHGRREEITTSFSGEPGHKRLAVIFQPKNLASIDQVHFAGAKNLHASLLEHAIAQAALHSDYTERRFRILLAVTLLPLYEERGFLNVKFVSVSTQPVSLTAVAVTAQIEEGIAYHLGDVRVTGDGVDSAALLKAAKLPIGKLANWKEISAGVAEAQRLLRRDGYLQAVALPQRSLHDDTAAADLVIEVTRGPQFRFGQLRIRGLDAALEAKARKLWKLAPGEPMNGEYTDEFFREVRRQHEFIQVKGFTVTLETGRAPEVVNVAITFK